MKTKFYPIAFILFLGVTFWSCESDDTSPDSDFSAQHQFVAMNWNEDSDDPPSFSLLSIDNGDLDFTPLTDTYPLPATGTSSNFRSWKQSFHQAKGFLGFTLHSDLSETVTNNYGQELTRWTGAYMDMRDGEVHELPTLSACTDFGYSSTDCNRYSYTQRHSVRIGASGHVFYIAESAYHSATWHDERRYRIVRLDPQTGDYDVSPLISDWTLSQPEINADRYGLANISDLLPSACGRYVYGTTTAWGISGGSLIASNALLFRYDFNSEQYSRVEEVPYDITLYYITADDRYIVYRNNRERSNYRYDTQTGRVTQIREASIGFSYQTMVNNNGGIGGAYPLRQLWHGDAVTDHTFKISVPNHPDRPVFSADGTQVYFRYRNCEMNYLLRLSDLTEEATVDTVAVLPDHVRVMTVY